MIKNSVVIVAGGTGTRMKSDIPKQFLKIRNVPVIVHTMKKFYDFDRNINMIVVVHKDYLKKMYQINQKYFAGMNVKVAEGGETRFHSVKNGLSCIESNKGVVGIHDAARPLVDIGVIELCFKTAARKGNAIPAVTVLESIRRDDKNGNRAVNRNEFKIIQTPQCFKVNLIKKAFENRYSSKFTDDATVLESIGEKINLVEGNFENIKITNPKDMLIANALMSK